MKKKLLIVVTICLLYLVSGLAGVVTAKPRGDAGVADIIYWAGDWIVNDVQIKENQTIVLTGNLTILAGGQLTLKNITLIMNSTAGGVTIADFYHIEVQRGGTLFIIDYDDDNTTRNDASNITLNDINAYYWFWVRDGSNFTMKNSELHRCGGWSVSSGGAGLMVYSDNVIVDHNVLSYNRYGIVLYGSDALVSNNTIEWNNHTGIYSGYWSNGTIENNLIDSNWVYGIWVTGGSNSAPKPSNPLILGNMIIDTGRGINTADGLQIEVSSIPIIKDTRVINSKEDGMYMWSLVNVVADNLTIDPQGGNFAVIGGGSWTKLSLTNSTIRPGAINDVGISQSCFTFTNTTFDHSRVAFGDASSNLTVNWYLHTFIEDNFGNPIADANIRIRENANGSYDKNFTADVNGYVNWTILREYYQIQSSLIDYNPYNITISKPGYQTAYAEVEMTESKSVVITLTDIENPIADAGPDQTVNEDTTVYLDGSGSTDNAEIVNYTWSFYDGGPLVNLYGINVSYIFAQPGTYTITLNVSDASGNWDRDTCAIYVNDITAPFADAGTDQSTIEDGVVYFDGSGSFDNVGIVWYNWTFGDGSYNNGTNQYPNHTYSNAGTHIVTLNVSDAAGNWDIDACLVFVGNVAPIANAGGNKTGNEGVTITFNGSASIDTSSDNSTLTYVWYFGDGNSEAGKIVNHAYADNDVHNATLVVTDDNGYVDADTCIVTVNNVAPAIMPVANQTAQQGVQFTLRINATDVPADTLTFSDNTTLFDTTPVTGIIQFTPTNGDVGNHFVNVTVTDDDLGSSSITFKITVNNTNDAPAIAPIPAQSATEDVPFTLQVIASDFDVGDTLTYSLTANPTGMSINPSTGLITWTPTNAAVGSHAVTVRVRDAAGLYDEKTFAITVANVNDVPTISTSSLANATEDAMYLYSIQASDVDVGDTLTYSLDSAPAFLSINPSNGLLFGTPANANVGVHQIIVNVSDGTTCITRAFNLTIINVNDHPTLNYIPPQTATEDMLFSLQVIGQDFDVGDILTYSLISSPSGMSINQVTGLITWTPTNGDVGSYTVIVRVSDTSGTFAERALLLTVANVNDAPTIATTFLLNATEGMMYLATVQAEDVDGNILMFLFDLAPSFLSINAETGLIYGMPTNDDVGLHQIVVNVSDRTTYTTRSFNLTVLNVNDLPVIMSYPITMTKLGSEYAYAVIAEDADGHVLAYSLVEAPEGMTINGQTGKITWTPTDAQAGQTYQVVVQVNDGNGSTTQTYSIAVDELPAEPYQPLFDDYVWIGIIILLVTIIMFLAYYMFIREKEEVPEEKQE